MWPDVDLFPFLLLGIRWALSVWNSLSFSSSWTSIIFFDIFFLPTVPVLYLTLIYRSENFVMYFPHVFIFFQIFQIFFYFTYTEFLLFNSKLAIPSSIMLNYYLAHPLNFFFIIFKIFSSSLTPFLVQIKSTNHCNMFLNLKWNTNYIFPLKFFSEL